MYGRYGVDQLGLVLVAVSCAISIVLTLFGLRHTGGRVFLALRILIIIPYLVFLFRAFSKNVEKRREENMKFMKFWSPCVAFFSKKSSQLHDKEHRYFTCPGCSRTLRVPKGKGKIEISCPHCGRKFKKRT